MNSIDVYGANSAPVGPTIDAVADLTARLAVDPEFSAASQVLILLAARPECRQDLAELLGLAAGIRNRGGATRVSELLAQITADRLVVRVHGDPTKALHFYELAEPGRRAVVDLLERFRVHAAAAGVESPRPCRRLEPDEAAMKMAVALEEHDAPTARELLGAREESLRLVDQLRAPWRSGITFSVVTPDARWLRAINEAWRSALHEDTSFHLAYLAVGLLGRVGLRSVQSRLFITLARHPSRSQSECATVIRCAPASLSERIRRMEAVGQVERADGARPTWSLTPLGRLEAELILDRVAGLRDIALRSGACAVRASLVERRSEYLPWRPFGFGDYTEDERARYGRMKDEGRTYGLGRLLLGDLGRARNLDLQLDPRSFSIEYVTARRAELLDAQVRALEAFDEPMEEREATS